MSPEVISPGPVLAHLSLHHLSPELISQHHDAPGFSLFPSEASRVHLLRYYVYCIKQEPTSNGSP